MKKVLKLPLNPYCGMQRRILPVPYDFFFKRWGHLAVHAKQCKVSSWGQRLEEKKIKKKGKNACHNSM
jgi:hypothetical protein